MLGGVQYLRSHATRSTGESAMIALALLKAEVPHNDPVIQACIAKVLARFEATSYTPEMMPGQGTYEAAASAMALANLDAEVYRSQLSAIATFIASHQNANGSWDYAGRMAGDASISQYAVLGLWECTSAGVEVSPSVFDRAASWYLSVQSGAGSWNYHRDEELTYPDSLSMTAAGVGSLLICQRQLAKFRGAQRGGGVSSLLTSLVEDQSNADYKPSTLNSSIDQGVKRGIAWLTANFSTTEMRLVGQTPYYMLYGIERIGALIDRQTLGKIDWYAKGHDFIVASQKPGGGSWTGLTATR